MNRQKYDFKNNRIHINAVSKKRVARPLHFRTIEDRIGEIDEDEIREMDRPSNKLDMSLSNQGILTFNNSRKDFSRYAHSGQFSKMSSSNYSKINNLPLGKTKSQKRGMFKHNGEGAGSDENNNFLRVQSYSNQKQEIQKKKFRSQELEDSSCFQVQDAEFGTISRLMSTQPDSMGVNNYLSANSKWNKHQDKSSFFAPKFKKKVDFGRMVQVKDSLSSTKSIRSPGLQKNWSGYNKKQSYKLGSSPYINGKQLRITRRESHTHSRSKRADSLSSQAQIKKKMSYNQLKIDKELKAIDHESQILSKFVNEVGDMGEMTIRISGLSHYSKPKKKPFFNKDLLKDVAKEAKPFQSILHDNESLMQLSSRNWKVDPSKTENSKNMVRVSPENNFLSKKQTDSDDKKKLKKLESTKSRDLPSERDFSKKGSETNKKLDSAFNKQKIYEENEKEMDNFLKKTIDQSGKKQDLESEQSVKKVLTLPMRLDTETETDNCDFKESKVEGTQLGLLPMIGAQNQHGSELFRRDMTPKETTLALIKAIFNKDLTRIQELLKIKSSHAILNTKDKRGMNPLILCTKLSHLDPAQYYAIINHLLEVGADPFLKDFEGWTAFEEAVNLTSVKISSILFDYMTAYKMKKIFNQIQTFNTKLKEVPDCLIEIKWEFDSSVIPLVSKFAPSDTFRIWKYKNHIRLDSTLAGYKRLKSKRRNMSVIYNPTNHFMSKHKINSLEGQSLASKMMVSKIEDNPFGIFSVNRTNKIYYNPLEDVDLEEKKSILYDIFNSMPVQGDLKIIDAEFQKSLGFFGGSIHKKVCGYKCQKFNINLKMEYMLNKKNKHLFNKSLEDYIKPYEFNRTDSTLSGVHRLSQSNIENSGNNIEVKFNKNKYNFTTKKKQIKNQSINIHLTKNHEFTLKELIPIIKILSSGNNLLKKLEDVLTQDIVDQIIDEGFPVKIQIPMNLSLRANVFIQKFERLTPEHNIDESHFEIPEDFVFQSRKVAQKILTRNKKRMLLANMILISIFELPKMTDQSLKHIIKLLHVLIRLLTPYKCIFLEHKVDLCCQNFYEIS